VITEAQLREGLAVLDEAIGFVEQGRQAPAVAR